MSNILLEQLKRDLVSDTQMQAHIALIKESRANTLVQSRVADWLVAWIQKGNFDSRSTTVSDYLKNNFQAHFKLDVKPTELIDAIQGIIDPKTAMIKDNLEQLEGSTRVLLAGRQPYELELVTNALTQVQGTRTVAAGYEKAANGEMAMNFSGIVNKTIVESGININPDDPQAAKAPLLQLQEQIATKLNESQHMFTTEFIAHAKTQVTDLQYDTQTFHAPLINNNEQNSLLDALVGKLESGNITWTVADSDGKSIDLSQLTDQELASRIDPAKLSKVTKSIETKLADYADMKPRDTEPRDVVVSAMQAEINRFSTEEKALLLIKAREADAIRSIEEKHGSRSLGELFNKVNFSSLLSVAAIGCVGGMIFGSPIMGIMITSLLSFLGKMDSGSKSKLAAPPLAAASN